MFEGGTISKSKSASIFRYAGSSIALILAVYLTLAEFNYIHTSHSLSNENLAIILIWWIIIAVFQLFVPIKTKLDNYLRLYEFFFLAAATMILAVGFRAPMLIVWALLVLIGYSYQKWRGFIISTIVLSAASLGNLLVWNNHYRPDVYYGVLFTLFAILTSAIFISIVRRLTRADKSLTLNKSDHSVARDRLLTIINNLTDAVISTDISGTINTYNSASLALLDTNVSLNGKKIDSAVPLIDKDGKTVSLLDQLKTARTVGNRDDLFFAYSEDDKVRLEVIFSPIRSSYSALKKSESRDGYVVIMRDITRQKSLEEERDEFISVISHELRTPITIAEGTVSNVQMMMDRDKIKNTAITNALGTAHDQIVFLAGMVNDLGTLSRAERGAYGDQEEINVKELANNLHKKYVDEARAKKLHLNLDLSPKLGKVYVSRLYLEELIQNFITNAIKYTKQGSVTIDFSQKDGKVIFAVTDTGIGISKSDQKLVFGKFFRSEDYRTRETSGTGLGLYIAAKLAHRMGTKIELSSRLNFGSTFSFRLPVYSNVRSTSEKH